MSRVFKHQEPIAGTIFFMNQHVITCHPRHTFTLGLAQWSREGENYSEVFNMSLSKESWSRNHEIMRHLRGTIWSS